jgi:hypothetical protein
LRQAYDYWQNQPGSYRTALRPTLGLPGARFATGGQCELPRRLHDLQLGRFTRRRHPPSPCWLPRRPSASRRACAQLLPRSPFSGRSTKETAIQQPPGRPYPRQLSRGLAIGHPSTEPCLPPSVGRAFGARARPGARNGRLVALPSVRTLLGPAAVSSGFRQDMGLCAQSPVRATAPGGGASTTNRSQRVDIRPRPLLFQGFSGNAAAFQRISAPAVGLH